MIKSCIIPGAVFLVFCGGLLVHADEGRELYDDGMMAYERGDCYTAIPLLKEYKFINNDKIPLFKNFFKKIDSRIFKCEKYLAAVNDPQFSETRGKSDDPNARGGDIPVPPRFEGLARMSEPEIDIDRAGSDYNNFYLPIPDPKLCQDACAEDGQCRAYTYVKPNTQGPQARCWLKNKIPLPKQNTCCVSGVVK